MFLTRKRQVSYKVQFYCTTPLSSFNNLVLFLSMHVFMYWSGEIFVRRTYLPVHTDIGGRQEYVVNWKAWPSYFVCCLRSKFLFFERSCMAICHAYTFLDRHTTHIILNVMPCRVCTDMMCVCMIVRHASWPNEGKWENFTIAFLIMIAHKTK